MTTESLRFATARDTAITRRTVLKGAAGGVGIGVTGALGLTAGCSSGSTISSSTEAGAGAAAATKLDNGRVGGKVLAAVFDASGTDDIGYVVTGSPQRLAFLLSTVQGDPILDGPESLEFTFTKDGKAVGAPVIAARHRDGVPIGYYPVRTSFTDTGIYQAAITIDGEVLTQALQVYDPAKTKNPGVGSKLPAVDTPTVGDSRGVEPICTAKPEVCPFHTMTLREALASGRPVAYMVSTPEFCQIGVCGPVLGLLVEAAATHPDMVFVHAEVYKDARARRGFEKAEPAEAITAFGLTYEPALFVTDATGTVVDRLDNVFDRAEIAAALKKAGSEPVAGGAAATVPGTSAPTRR